MHIDRDEIMALKKNNSELAKKNQLLLQIIESVSEAIYAIDKNDTVILYNKAAEMIEDRKRSDVLGKNEKDLYQISDYRAYTGKIKKTGESVLNAKHTYRLKDGIPRSVIMKVIPFCYHGEYEGIYSIATNTKLLKVMYQNALEIQHQLMTNATNYEIKDHTGYRLNNIIAKSKAMKKVIDLSGRVAKRNSSVMIIGETGTGKEMIAQGIHYAGEKRNGPFVPVNCAGIPDSLLESILFGTAKGAFTGAKDMPGLFEQANNGTIFLDEINSMPQPFQAKLLRVLQEKKVRRIGSQREIPVHCRIISACHEDPFGKPEKFRPDLFYRLAVINIRLPALRDRQEDVLPLTDHFIKYFNKQFMSSINGIDDELPRILFTYEWPGNVRELQNMIESAMNFVEEDETKLRLEHFPQYFRKRLLPFHFCRNHGNSLHDTTLPEALSTLEQGMILKALEDNHWNISRTAKQLGILRQSLQAKLKRYCFTSHFKRNKAKLLPTQAEQKRENYQHGIHTSRPGV
jgi:arginine utilization regulatory protein